ncbi:MAG: YkgJ family cysteine cluster protein [Sulfurimonas sp.]|uniref:YkgJ family cysteine cluster protein n=1 Tax=Sulfurimonas sp. TaxID=2022749 RepID=UPI0025F6EDCA|nr:YkgJ family cysteine cluster protein [Sulfurimonas sp.]MCK9491094.1 YkgJ family cysteine cluster protein [Sulfurimonas sp.]
MSSLMKKEGFSYTFDSSACFTCGGRCCTGESGYIYVNKSEIEEISNFLNINTRDFVAEYLYREGFKYSIKERKIDDSYECIFYDRTTNGCGVYEARPIQCRTFPFWDYFKTRLDELQLECPGIILGSDDD